MNHQSPKPKRVAIYTRWSSKRPQLSLARQMAEIRKYAKRRGFKVVMAYADEAKGGGKA
jgi:DNA invertase Pin-like site-specific DNA recombinase